MKKYKENLKTKLLETYSNLLYSVEYVVGECNFYKKYSDKPRVYELKIKSCKALINDIRRSSNIIKDLECEYVFNNLDLLCDEIRSYIKSVDKFSATIYGVRKLTDSCSEGVMNIKFYKRWIENEIAYKNNMERYDALNKSSRSFKDINNGRFLNKYKGRGITATKLG